MPFSAFRTTGSPPDPDRAPETAGAAASQLLRRYRPLETRATGSFGSVEICLDTRLKRRVAIKRIPLCAQGAAWPQTTAAALAEAQTASMLQHPHIVSVIDFTYDAAFAYLVMEYVDGMNLAEFLAGVDGHSLTYDETACIAEALAAALSFAHDNGVLHLDIKPANVLIDRSGHVKLADFGMASLASAAGFGGARGGTVGYMSPEQLEGYAVDERADTFSLAAVLYEGLCGTAPFLAPTPDESLALIEAGPEAPDLVLPDIPVSAEDVLLAALLPDPAMRPLTTAAFADVFLEDLGSARAGRKSLAALIAQLTSDDVASDQAADPANADAAIPLDPALGYLGSHWPYARRAAFSAIAGLSSAGFVNYLLQSLHAAQDPARLIAASACALASALAPELGSAVTIAVLIATLGMSLSLLPALATISLVAALGAGWWLVWGRMRAASAASLLFVVGLTCLPDASLFVGAPALALTGCFLAPVDAAATMLIATVLGRLAASMIAEGVAGIHTAIGGLAHLECWVSAIGLALLAAGIAAAMKRVRSRITEDHAPAAPEGAQSINHTNSAYGVFALPLFGVPMLYCLAFPMEITGSAFSQLPAAVALGALSSILGWICIYLLGLRAEPTEADRP
ncbi:serine/threonine protein kinase [Collinsella sp. AGMB00827]|uniref:non-specific serine/threonine protein kinase n=1 Tax=Collinsella ureilytica TaxID=2869515 RepID=A0ABS7MKN4_9ACTN|nr:serine/threonine-protein kinase [Collinsella urealyticum]MBY4797603.1 serine/threonine protein kinase [Collinsella urealyticum]